MEILTVVTYVHILDTPSIENIFILNDFGMLLLFISEV